MPVNERTSQNAIRIENALNHLTTFQLFKSWNIFATRIFYFATPIPGQEQVDDGSYRLTLECPWRIEQENQILIGSEDYLLRASHNSAIDWSPTEMQWGHLDDEKLREIMGEEKNGSIFNSGEDLIVVSVQADNLGGFQLSLSGGYTLSVFPASGTELEWLISRSSGGNIALTNGVLSGSL